MEEEGVHSQQEDRGTEEEVDALFQKTQRNETGSNDRYDFYVPLAVRIENPKWDCLNPNMDPNTNEECAKAIDMGNFYRVPADNRGLNYDKYFKDGDEKRNTLTEFNSNNTKRLNLEETKEKIASLEYIQAELAKME